MQNNLIVQDEKSHRKDYFSLPINKDLSLRKSPNNFQQSKAQRVDIFLQDIPEVLSMPIIKHVRVSKGEFRMSPAESAKRLFLKNAIRIPGVLKIDVVRGRRGDEFIYVTTPNIFGDVAWEITQLKGRIEDNYPTVEINLRIQDNRQNETEDLASIAI